MMEDDGIYLYTDGAARGNPGPGACAFLAVSDDSVLHSDARFLGRVTNNIAEYSAIIMALGYAASSGYRRVVVTSDSQLAIRQLSGDWKVRNATLADLYAKVKELERVFAAVTYRHVRRTNQYIQKADALANKELDARL